MLKKFMITRALASLGDSILMFALPLMIYKVTGSVVYSGIAFVVEWLPRVLWLPFSGLFVDRFGGKKVLIASDLLRAIACAGMFVAMQLHLFTNMFLPLAILSAVVALLSGQTFIALEAVMRKILTPEEMPKGQSMLEGCNMISLLMGPGVGACLIGYFDIRVLFALSALIYSGGLINLMTMHMKETGSGAKGTGADLVAGLRSFLGARRLMGIALLGAMANLIYGGAMALAPAITKMTFAQSDQAYGAMVSTLGFTSLLSLTVVPWLGRKFAIEGLRLASLGVIFAGGIGMILAPAYWVFVLGFGLLLGGITILNIFMRTLRAKEVPKENFAGTVSLMIMVSQVPLPLSGLIVSRMGDTFPTATILGAIVGLAALVAVAANLLLSEKVLPIVLNSTLENSEEAV